MIYQVYILYSPSADRYYIGFTGDELNERIRKHNSRHKGFTGSKTDWQLKYFEEYTDKKSAMQREKEIKSWKSKRKIENLIAGSHG